uniref:RRM domain-containing protein n=1 Tax=Leptobrachium leishanense TaxID=445787 RepID=A0A8C5PPU8_9ANUR
SINLALTQNHADARSPMDAWLKLGVKDAREKLAAKDARFRIKGKVQDAREMLNSRKLQVSSDKTPKVVDACEKLSLKRSSPADVSPAIASGSSTIKFTKTNLEDDDDEDYVEEMELSHVPAKQMKITTQNSMLKQSGSPFSVAQAQALTKVPITIPPPLRTKPMTNICTSNTDSPLEGTKITFTNLHPRVTEDIVELFCVCGALKRGRLLSPGIAEVVFVRKNDAMGAYKKYNRYLDGQPMKCNLHLNGSVTSDQPVLLRLSDTPATTNKEGEA